MTTDAFLLTSRLVETTSAMREAMLQGDIDEVRFRIDEIRILEAAQGQRDVCAAAKLADGRLGPDGSMPHHGAGAVLKKLSVALALH